MLTLINEYIYIIPIDTLGLSIYTEIDINRVNTFKNTTTPNILLNILILFYFTLQILIILSKVLIYLISHQIPQYPYQLILSQFQIMAHRCLFL